MGGLAQYSSAALILGREWRLNEALMAMWSGAKMGALMGGLTSPHLYDVLGGRETLWGTPREGVVEYEGVYFSKEEWELMELLPEEDKKRIAEMIKKEEFIKSYKIEKGETQELLKYSKYERVGRFHIEIEPFEKEGYYVTQFHIDKHLALEHWTDLFDPVSLTRGLLHIAIDGLIAHHLSQKYLAYKIIKFTHFKNYWQSAIPGFMYNNKR